MMIIAIATEAGKDEVLEQIASIQTAEPGSADEARLMELVASVSVYVAERDGSGEALS